MKNLLTANYVETEVNSSVVCANNGVQQCFSFGERSDLNPRLDNGKVAPTLTLSRCLQRKRIAFYSHDTMGLGHNRRNQLLAQTLAGSGLQADILMIVGMREQNALPMPSGVDYLTLPALYKEVDGQYRSRHLHLCIQKLIDLRQRRSVQRSKPLSQMCLS